MVRGVEQDMLMEDAPRQDLITYRVGDLDPIEIHEAVIGTGKWRTPRCIDACL